MLLSPTMPTSLPDAPSEPATPRQEGKHHQKAAVLLPCLKETRWDGMVGCVDSAWAAVVEEP